MVLSTARSYVGLVVNKIENEIMSNGVGPDIFPQSKEDFRIVLLKIMKSL